MKLPFTSTFLMTAWAVRPVLSFHVVMMSSYLDSLAKQPTSVGLGSNECTATMASNENPTYSVRSPPSSAFDQDSIPQNLDYAMDAYEAAFARYQSKNRNGESSMPSIERTSDFAVAAASETTKTYQAGEVTPLQREVSTEAGLEKSVEDRGTVPVEKVKGNSRSEKGGKVKAKKPGTKAKVATTKVADEKGGALQQDDNIFLARGHYRFTTPKIVRESQPEFLDTLGPEISVGRLISYIGVAAIGLILPILPVQLFNGALREAYSTEGEVQTAAENAFAKSNVIDKSPDSTVATRPDFSTGNEQFGFSSPVADVVKSLSEPTSKKASGELADAPLAVRVKEEEYREQPTQGQMESVVMEPKAAEVFFDTNTAERVFTPNLDTDGSISSMGGTAENYGMETVGTFSTTPLENTGIASDTNAAMFPQIVDSAPSKQFDIDQENYLSRNIIRENVPESYDFFVENLEGEGLGGGSTATPFDMHAQNFQLGADSTHVDPVLPGSVDQGNYPFEPAIYMSGTAETGAGQLTDLYAYDNYQSSGIVADISSTNAELFDATAGGVGYTQQSAMLSEPPVPHTSHWLGQAPPSVANTFETNEGDSSLF